jgi:WD40 repeat protein
MQHRGPIAGIAVHGNHVATAGYCNQIILWDAVRHEAVARAHHDHLVNQCAFNSTGSLLVSAGSDYSARIWEVPSLRLKAVLAEHDDDVDMAVFSPDDSLIATCALDRCVRIFTIDGHCMHTMRGHTGNVLSLAWSADGSRLVSSSVDGTLREWCAQSGVELRAINLDVRSDSVAMDKRGRIWAGDDRGRIALIVDGVTTYSAAHRAGIKKIVLDTVRQVLVSLSYDRAVAIWGIAADGSLNEISRSICPAAIWARAAAILDDGRVAVGTFGSTYAVFDWRSGEWDLAGVRAGRAINSVLAQQDGVYTVGDAGLVEIDGRAHAEMGSLCNFLVAIDGLMLTGGQLGQLYNAGNGEILYEHHSPLNCGVNFTHQGRPHVAIGTYTGEILVFESQSGAKLNLIANLSVYKNAVKGLAANGTTLFSVCASTEIAWHRLEDFSLVKHRHKAHERIANGCCPAGERDFASIGRDRVLRIWSETGDSSYATPHPNSVKCIAVNPERSLLMTGSYGGTVAAFDLHTRRWYPMQRPTASGISSLAWDARRGGFLAASYDGNVYPVAP